MVHVKKCDSRPFRALRAGDKHYEFRKEDDCHFEIGDMLILLEHNQKAYWDGMAYRSAGFTGEVERCRVTYITRGEYGLPEGYAILGVELLDKVPQPESASPAAMRVY